MTTYTEQKSGHYRHGLRPARAHLIPALFSTRIALSALIGTFSVGKLTSH